MADRFDATLKDMFANPEDFTSTFHALNWTGKAVDDLGRLDRMADAILYGGSWEELLAVQ